LPREVQRRIHVGSFFFAFLAMALSLPGSLVWGEDPFKPVLESPHHLVPLSPSEKTTCPVCHLDPDRAKTTPPPLWDRGGHTYTLPTMKILQPTYRNQPTGSSLDCLACHDGAVGTDMHGILPAKGVDAALIPSSASLGRLDHPISVSYPRRSDGTFFPPNPTSTYARYWSIPDKDGQKITLPTGPTSNYFSVPEASALGEEYNPSLVRTTRGTVQCDSCHNPHDPRFRPFLRTTPQSLCLVCHDR